MPLQGRTFHHPIPCQVAFVSLDDFEQRHADGTVDTVAAGVQQGQ